jgi:hypothetical protein
MHQKIVVLHTSTFQFSLIDVPTPLMAQSYDSSYKLGETKDEKLCFVDIKDDTLYSYFRTAGVVERWMLYKEFPLRTIVKNVTGGSVEQEGCPVDVEVVAVIDGFVYLTIFYCKDTQLRDLCLSLCLETSEISELFSDAREYHEEVHPYVMAWPPSLLQSKVSLHLCVKYSSGYFFVDSVHIIYLRALDCCVVVKSSKTSITS